MWAHTGCPTAPVLPGPRGGCGTGQCNCLPGTSSAPTPPGTSQHRTVIARGHIM